MSEDCTTTSVDALAEAALFERMKNIKLLVEAVNKAIAAQGVKAQVAAWLDVLALGASFTPSGNDDAIVAKIREFLAGPMAEKIIGIIADLVGGMLDGKAQAADAEAQATVEAAAIPWTLILSVAKIIFDLIKSFKKPTE